MWIWWRLCWRGGWTGKPMKWPMMTMCNKAKVWLSVETRARVKGGQRPLAIFLHCPASQCCTACTAAPWGCEHTACEGWVAIIALILRIPSTPLLLLLLRIKNGDEETSPPIHNSWQAIRAKYSYICHHLPQPLPPSLNTTLQWVLLSYSPRRFCALSPSATYSSAIQWSHEGHATALIVKRRWGGGAPVPERERERERASSGQPTTCSYYGLGMLYLDHLHSCSTIFLHIFIRIQFFYIHTLCIVMLMVTGVWTEAYLSFVFKLFCGYSV